MEDINVHLFIHSSTISLILYMIAVNSFKLYSKLQGLSIATTDYPPIYA
jgi:hypothetical protein